MARARYQVVVIGGGHAGVEAAWAAANLLGSPRSVALVTLDPSKIGVMSCNPANGGLAKGQLVREIDAMGGVMGLATDAAGIQFKILNTSKGPAVWGPRAQCDKHAYAEGVQAMIASRPEIDVLGAAVDDLLVERGSFGARITGVALSPSVTTGGWHPQRPMTARILAAPESLACDAVVLTTGTFMRGLMHTGETRTPGGRHGEAPAIGIAGALARLGFELGRLKTGTPPRLRRGSIDWDGLQPQHGDATPTPLSDLSASGRTGDAAVDGACSSLARFPVLPQAECRLTGTTPAMHDLIRANLGRAPMFSGQIEGVGPRYCPSIEDKVVRFPDRQSHTVFLEPESLRDDWIYCNGISTSLPADVQDRLVRAMPGCAHAEILRHGYAVEYDMVRPHQIRASGMTKAIRGLFLGGQINGTSGYEEAAAQGLVAGINAARIALSMEAWLPQRSESYLGVLMDDLVTKTPLEPYRMFTSRAEHRLLLRSDNAADRLTPIAADLSLLSNHRLGHLRQRTFVRRRADLDAARTSIDASRVNGEPLSRLMARPEFGVRDLSRALTPPGIGTTPFDDRVLLTLLADRQYASFVDRQRAEVKRQSELERRRLPDHFDYASIPGLRAEARAALTRFRPETFGQAGRLEGLTPADVTILAVFARRAQDAGADPARRARSHHPHDRDR